MEECAVQNMATSPVVGDTGLVPGVGRKLVWSEGKIDPNFPQLPTNETMEHSFHPGVILFPRGLSAMSGHISGCHNWGREEFLLAPSG